MYCSTTEEPEHSSYGINGPGSPNVSHGYQLDHSTFNHAKSSHNKSRAPNQFTGRRANSHTFSHTHTALLATVRIETGRVYERRFSITTITLDDNRSTATTTSSELRRLYIYGSSLQKHCTTLLE